jgi:hypothetical protein
MQGACYGKYFVDSPFMELGKKETRPHNERLLFIEQICGYSFLCMLSKKGDELLVALLH